MKSKAIINARMCAARAWCSQHITSADVCSDASCSLHALLAADVPENICSVYDLAPSINAKQ
jgi:hypothetical protein